MMRACCNYRGFIVKQHDTCRQQTEAHINKAGRIKMKAKKVIAGAVAGLSFLALAATGAFALVICDKGTVHATGAGHTYAGNGVVVPALRSVTLTCEGTLTKTAAIAALDGTWDPAIKRIFVIPGTPDKDGVYAAALTAMADAKPVSFVLQNADAPAAGTTKGQIRMLHVLAQ